MTWVAWRQARSAGYGLLAVTLGFTALALLERTEELSGMTRSLSIYLSLFVGVLLGAPLLAQEFEHGTYRMVWTQGVTRVRWLAGRCAVALTITLAGTAVVHGAVIALAEGGRGRPALLPAPVDGLDTAGLSPYARAVWMLALGLLAGAVLRRTVGAVAVTAGGWMATQLLFDNGLPRWVPDGWQDDFWAVQLGASGLLLGLTALAVVGTLFALGLRPALPVRRPAVTLVRPTPIRPD
ncbi:hypothetical protein [Plantactinospora endophytica]|uniref:ABC transporter permease n=1 Tax=Plantactinospora endophytica TaxID=673535 RepID=A0ABQ4E8T6_9ACTN|nr:hypothetical protein [Plantactinospora endophytica]GIG91151.1 hypothetical protein Pen02_60870 [Plantactinospora endophytica]